MDEFMVKATAIKRLRNEFDNLVRNTKNWEFDLKQSLCPIYTKN